MPEELYGIDLSPGGGVPSVPGGATPNGSIGGSDVGANEQDDQRVRDLVEQRVEELNIVNNIKVLQAAGAASGMVYEGGLHKTGYQVVTQLANPHVTSGSGGVGTFCLTYATADPKLVHFSCEILAEWKSLATVFPASHRFSIEIYNDGVFVAEIINEISFWNTARTSVQFTCSVDFFLGHGAALANPAVLVAAQTPLVAVGEHSFQIDAAWLAIDCVNGTFDYQVKNVHIDVMRVNTNAVAANNCDD